MELNDDPARVFTWAYEVKESDIDMLGHASNVAYVQWIQDAAVAHSESVGFGFEAYRELGAVFVVRRHEVDYLRPVVRSDRLELRTWLSAAMAAKSERRTEIRNSGGVVVARAVTIWGFVDLTSGRPLRIPDPLRAAFGVPPRLPAELERGVS